jgi:hypothetical protein
MLRNNKKSQITGEVFVYLMAAIIFTLVVIYGYRAINDFLARSEQVSLIEFSQDIKSTVKRISSGSDVEKKTFLLPKKYTEICFIDIRQPASTCPTFATSYPIIYNSWEDGVEQNVFLVPHSDLKMYVGDIKVNGNCECITINNHKVDLRLEGRGDSTLISEWPS